MNTHNTEQIEPLAEALRSIASALERLGTNRAYTPGAGMGAVEVLAKEVREGSTRIAEALNNVAEAIRYQFEES